MEEITKYCPRCGRKLVEAKHKDVNGYLCKDCRHWWSNTRLAVVEREHRIQRIRDERELWNDVLN